MYPDPALPSEPATTGVLRTHVRADRDPYGLMPWSPCGPTPAWHRTAAVRADEPASATPVLLIEVPLVPRRVREARRPSAAATERFRAHPGGRPLTRRRRLRKELRVAGYLLATALPLALAVGLLRGTTAQGGNARPAVAVEAFRPPTVSLTLDPAGFGPLGEPGTIVELPGYLLPDEGAEEPAHAGG